MCNRFVYVVPGPCIFLPWMILCLSVIWEIVYHVASLLWHYTECTGMLKEEMLTSYISCLFFLWRPKKFTLKSMKRGYFIFRDTHLTQYKSASDTSGSPVQKLNLKGEQNMSTELCNSRTRQSQLNKIDVSAGDLANRIYIILLSL